MSKRVDNINLKVELSDGNEEIVLTINPPLENLGNQFITFNDKSYIMCKNCGKLVKIKSKHDGSTIYCDKCANDIRDKKIKEAKKRYYKKRIKG